jgi:hypothetical protein
MKTRICKTCKKEFKIHNCWVKKGEGIYCSRSCQFPIRKITIKNGKCFIPLTKNRTAICDEIDYEKISGMNWYSFRGNRGIEYAASHPRGGGRNLFMHRHILGIKDFKIKIDHKNNDGLDNRRCNIRKCTNTENSHNSRLSKRNTSGLKGVSLIASSGRWYSQIRIHGKNHFLGSFSNKVDASNAYKQASLKHFKEFSPYDGN